MTEKYTGGPAFPCDPFAASEPNTVTEAKRLAEGMTLRDYFAAKAMQTLIGSEYTSGHGLHEGWMYSLAHESYMVADAMLKAREA